jgi:hypothetical protein
MVSGANELDELELQTDELDFERTVPPEQNSVEGLYILLSHQPLPHLL